MEDKLTDAPMESQSNLSAAETNDNGEAVHESNRDRKRKRFGMDNLKHGRGNKKRDMGRGKWERDQVDRRTRNDMEKAKRATQGDKPSMLPAGFAQDEIDAEDRKPKRKVAVMVGYSGTGYKGMQISTTEKTIEGDLFAAFVKAGAISKANADDPKKSGLVRCARTDKGVHAAGNMISLKLIIEDENIVEKINQALSPQIRVWGIERTIGSFSCYQGCDSRWYEYLMPSHAFLPPHPSSFLGKKLVEYADEVNDREGYEYRQEEVKGFWEKVEAEDIKPILDTLDNDIKPLVEKALYDMEDSTPDKEGGISVPKQAADVEDTVKVSDTSASGQATGTTESAAIIINEPALKQKEPDHEEIQPREDTTAGAGDNITDSGAALPPSNVGESRSVQDAVDGNDPHVHLSIEQKDRLFQAIRKLKGAYDTAKRRYRIPKQRIDRIQAALDKYIGTRNFHNYTIHKPFKDPSAKRQIKSFVVNPTPIIINGTEWLSLKVHGQSFMMHQIRKMVGMASLMVRCGTDVARIDDSYTEIKYSIPKVPGLGLLLERPVFDTYNTSQAPKHDRATLDFGRYEKEIEAFKQSEIYEKIFQDEQRENTFHQFFNHVDSYREPHFLFLTSKGIEATKRAPGEVRGKGLWAPKLDMESEDEDGVDDN